MTTNLFSRKVPQELRAAISQEIMTILEDPDFGLELSDYAKKRLTQARKNKSKNIPFPEIKKRYL